jgi:hypothetical protein
MTNPRIVIFPKMRNIIMEHEQCEQKEWGSKINENKLEASPYEDVESIYILNRKSKRIWIYVKPEIIKETEESIIKEAIVNLD